VATERELRVTGPIYSAIDRAGVTMIGVPASKEPANVATETHCASPARILCHSTSCCHCQVRVALLIE
jgi:hypothetical protein